MEKLHTRKFPWKESSVSSTVAIEPLEIDADKNIWICYIHLLN